MQLRRLLGWAGATVVALALTASTATAQEPVEVLQEGTAEHCLLGTPACAVHANSFDDGGNHIHLLAHPPGMGEVVVANCKWEMTVELDEEGLGFISAITLTPGTANCGGAGIRPCRTGGVQDPWPILETMELHDPPVALIHYTICLEGTSVGTLQGELRHLVTESSFSAVSRRLQGQTPAPGAGVPQFEIDGVWLFESHKWTLVH